MKKRISVILTIMIVMMLAACGSQGTSSKSGSGGKSEESGSLARIQKEKVINIGIEGVYPPFNYHDQSDKLVGFDVDIAEELASRMGVKANFVETPWDTIIGGLLSNKYDIIVSSMAITPERQKKVDFTDPYYHTGAQLFVNKGYDRVKDPEKDLQGKKIGVAIGTTFEKKAVELGAQVTNYKSDLLTFQDLAVNRVEGVITDKAVGARIIKENGYPFESIGDVLYEEEAGISLNKGEDALKEEINKHLKAMMDDGTYEKISVKWFGEDIR
ncbi:transporter substrate-binding domain-containing protein [Bacillus songklensis]|uniref:Transporter substrate-binding domain-containing protein n=1 Tax=Bacillus songklensis TaxID=1069116 RepID=A0ABV8B8U3_9BACI